MIARHLTEKVSVIPIGVTDVEYVVSEAAGRVWGYGMSTDAIAFILVEWSDVESVEEVGIVTVHCTDLGQA